MGERMARRIWKFYIVARLRSTASHFFFTVSLNKFTGQTHVLKAGNVTRMRRGIYSIQDLRL